MIMKKTNSTLRAGAVALALSIAALTNTSFAQTTATTVPVGFMTVTIPNAVNATTPSNAMLPRLHCAGRVVHRRVAQHATRRMSARHVLD